MKKTLLIFTMLISALVFAVTENTGRFDNLTSNDPAKVTVDVVKDIMMESTGGLYLASGTTSQRIATPTRNGLIRYNSTTDKVEAYTNGAWGSIGGGIANWATATAYSVDDVVIQSSKIYQCLIAHTSGTFATDLAAVDWVELANNVSSATGTLSIVNGGTGSSMQNFVDLTTDQSIAGSKTFSSNIIGGDAGTEGSGIDISGVMYQSTLKVSDIDGTNFAQTILHRHSTTLEPLILGARSNSNTSSHANITAGQSLFTIYGAGYETDNYKLFGSINIAASSLGSLSSTSSPGKIVFSTTPNTSVSPETVLTLDSDKSASFTGNLSVGSGGDLSTPRTTVTINNSGYAAPSAINSTSVGDKFLFWNSSTYKGSVGEATGELWLQSQGTGVNGKMSFYTGASGAPASMVLAREGNLGIGTTAPNASAVLDLTSTTKAFMPPRMTTAQKNSISTPTESMLVFDTDLDKIYVYDGASWVAVGAAVDLTGAITSVGAVTSLGTFTSSSLSTAVTDETGSGLAVFNDAPTFTTNITAPLIIGGTETTSTLTLQPTSGVGASDADIIFKVGNNGATEAMRVVNSGSVGIGATPNVNAILDVSSTSKAFMPPRMTTAQKNAIATPTASMVVYDTDIGSLNVHNGTSWISIMSQAASTTNATVFSWQVSVTGVVSGENLDVINGNCTDANPSVCSFNSNIFTVAPNCTTTSTNTANNLAITVPASSTTASVTIQQNSSLVATREPFTVSCQKSGADYVSAANSGVVATTLTGYVQTPGISSGNVAVFSASYGTTNGTTVCSASPCSYLDQIGTEVTSVTRASAGAYTVNLSRTYTKLKCTINGSLSSTTPATFTNMFCSSCNSIGISSYNIDAAPPIAINSNGTFTCVGTY